MSRHRRQPSRALPLDFNIDGGDEGPAADKGGATSIDGSQQNPRAGGSGDAGGAGKGKGHEGQTTNKPPPPATGSRTPSDGTTGGNKPRHDDGTRGR